MSGDEDELIRGDTDHLADPDGNLFQQFKHELGPPSGIVGPETNEDWAQGYNQAHRRAVEAARKVLRGEDNK